MCVFMCDRKLLLCVFVCVDVCICVCVCLCVTGGYSSVYLCVCRCVCMCGRRLLLCIFKVINGQFLFDICCPNMYVFKSGTLIYFPEIPNK